MPSGLRLPGFASVHSTGSENTSLATAGRRSPRLGGSSTCTTEQTSRGVLNDVTNMSAALPGLAYGKSGKPSISGQASVPVPMAAAQAPTAATRQLSACGSAEVHTHTANATAVEAEMDNAQSCSEYAGGIYSQLFRDEDSHDAFAEAATDGRGSNYDMRVAVRMRPLLPKEISERCGECVAVDYGGNQVTIGKATFAFDKVFGLDSTQEGVYEQTCLPLIEGLGAGLNATLLAYGQTSAGKTFTLGSGKSQVHEDQQGIIPRFVNALFRDVIYAKRAEADIAVRVSFVELHNEDINDLLDPNFLEKKGGTVSIRDDPLQGVIVQGMKEVNVSKPSELMRCLEQGAVFRTTASTLMNDQSSRSHAIFTVSVESRLHATGDLISARIRFADLAGSERAKKTGTVAGSERFREGININQGLLALGNVISALGDPKFLKNHVPYRDSKLTRLLQDSLGGNSRTLMIACVSPADAHFGETLNTLQYANRAKNIKNKVVVNLHLLDPEITKLKEVIQELQIELSKARQVPQQLGNGDAAPVAAQDGVVELLDSAAVPGSYEKLERENRQLRVKVASLELNLHQATDSFKQYREKYENSAQTVSEDQAGFDVIKAPEGPIVDSEAELARNMRRIRELRLRNMRLETIIEQAHAQDELEPVAEPPSEGDRRESQWGIGSTRSSTPQVVGDENADGAVRPRQSPRDSFDIDSNFVGETGGQLGDSEIVEEQMAHVEEDAREEERHVFSQRGLHSTVQELDEVIKEKEVLMDQLTKQSAVFHSMKARYEMRLQELKGEVDHATEEKEQMLKEMRQLITTNQTAPVIKDETSRRKADDASKRKAHLEGRLREVNRQLAELRRRQVEAQRLLRLKEQQEQQIQRMTEEISRLRGQKQVVLSRMKFEEQEHRLWRKRWTSRLNELTKHNAELQNKSKRQDKLVQLKTEEAARSAQKVEELRREQNQHLEASRRRVQVERNFARASRLREANERLQRELEEREKRVKQMEAMLAEKERLQLLGLEGARELIEVEEAIETLDAQIEFDSECIAQSQTDILRLTSSSGRNRPKCEEGSLSQTAASPRASGSTAGAATDAAGADEALCMTTSAEAIVARLSNLEEARVTCLACLQSIGDLRTDNGRLQARLAEIEAEAVQRSGQLDELQARERLAETKWAEQANAMQRLHLDKEVFLLSRVDRNLTHEQRPAAGEPIENAQPRQLAESPTVSQLHAAEEPSDTASLTREALISLLNCRTDQNEVLTQQAEHLHRSLERADRAASEAEMNASLARWEADKVRFEAQEHPHRQGDSLLPPQKTLCLATPDETRESRRAAKTKSPLQVQDEDSEISSGEEPDVGDAVKSLRSFVEKKAEEQTGDLGILEGTIEMATGQLRHLWLDLGLDIESQQRELRGLADGAIRLCARELRRHAGSRARLRQRHDELNAMAATYALELEDQESKSACSTAGPMPLYQQHAVLQAAFGRELERRIAYLRSWLQELFGLSANTMDGQESTSAISAQLRLLEGPGAHCLPGRGDVESLLKQVDLDILGISEAASREWLRQPSSETFATLVARLNEVNTLHSEMSSQFRKVDVDLRAHFAVLGAPVQKQEDFFASRGIGLPALIASQRELLRLQHSARLRVAEGRVRMAEQWMELGTSGSEQEAVLQRLRACAERDALSELQALGEETGRLEAKIESRREILRKVEAHSVLEAQIFEFDRETSDSNRLRGSSTRLMQEEQLRKSFRKRKQISVEELVAKLGQWEQTQNERFLHNGLAIQDSLQQDLETMREKAHSQSSAQLHKASSQLLTSANTSHSSLASAQSATLLSGAGSVTPRSARRSMEHLPGTPRSAIGTRSTEPPPLSSGSRVLTSVPEQRHRRPGSVGPPDNIATVIRPSTACRFSPPSRE